MKKFCAILPALVVLPLSAQTWEVGAFLGQQAYRSDSLTNPALSATLDTKVDSKFIFGLRVGRSVVDLGPALLQVTLGYQPPIAATATITETYDNAVPGVAPRTGGIKTAMVTTSTSGDYKASAFSVGAMFNFKAFVALGAGLEYRFEKLETEGLSTTYGRPWLRLNAGIAIPSPVVKPFVGIEANLPLSSKSLSDIQSDEDMLKAMAPKSQIGVYAGIRF